MPSAVPIFYGLRESDVEEITNAITEESTRLVSIWGSPGFGKTSTAVETAHKLSALGYPVYFFHLQGIDTVDKFLSKILSIFGSNLADINLTAEDKLITIFTKISRPIILILDNIDDLLTSETTLAKLVSLFLEFLNSNSNITILVTSRELLENMRDQVKGFQNVRIRPLSPVSSFNFVRQLLPSFSQDVVSRVAAISSHVPLAIKLVTSMIKDNSENMANKVLDELELPKHRMEHLQQPIQKFFDMPYEQLTLNEKHALISLTVFSSATINKDAAIDVVSVEKGSTSYAIKSLKTLVKKSLVDEDLNGEYYSIHPLIFSFIMDKANGNDLLSVLYCAKVRFCNYYLLTFERVNEDFLSGLLVHDSAMDDILLHLGTVVNLVSTKEFESSQQDLFRILSKAEIFFFMIHLPSHTRISICTLYDQTIQKHKSIGNDSIYSKLFVSYYFQTIAFSLSLANACLNIPEDIRIKVDRLLDGTAAKLSCYQGIFSICHGHVKDGIQQIEMSFDSLQNNSDQRLLKCLCLQILILYYDRLKEFNKVDEFKKLAIKVCEEIGNINLFLIDPRSISADGDVGETIILFSYLLMRWSHNFSTNETIGHICDFVHSIQERPVLKECSSHFSHQIQCYADSLVVGLGLVVGDEALLDEKIEFLTKSREKLQGRENALDWHWSERLLNMYSFKGTLMKKKHQCIEACKKALNISLQHYGKQHVKTAECYLNISVAENANDNHSCALHAIDQALNIINSLRNQPEAIDFGSRIYLEQGKTYQSLGKFTLAIESCENALEMRRRMKINEESKIVAEVLDFLASVQIDSNDLASALATNRRCLEIRVKLFSEKKIPFGIVAGNHFQLANVYLLLGNRSESRVHFERALQLLNAADESDKECVFRKCLIYLQLLQLKGDEDLYIKLLLEDMHVIKEHNEEFLPVLFLKLADNQLESGKYEAALTSLQKALDFELDVLREAACECRVQTVYCYLQVLNTLLRIGTPDQLVRKLFDKAIEVSGLLPKCRQPYWLFCCYSGKAVFHDEKQEYVEEIDSLKEALLQFSKIPDERKDNMSEFLCLCQIARAQIHEKNYEEALKYSYEAISVMKNIFPEGSEVEANLFLMVAQVANELSNKKLVVSNLRLAYKMCSKVLGENHPKTHMLYLTYVQALMN